MENKTENSQKNRNVFFVGLLSFFGGISQDVFAPILPIYLTTILGFDKTVVGIAEGIVTASSYFFNIVAGWLSDKFRKHKPIIFLGYFLSMMGRVCLVFFTSIGAVVGLRLLDGTGKGIKEPPKDVLVAGSSEKNVRGKSFGIATMLDTLGSVVGPLILFALLWVFEKSGVASKPLYDNILFFSAIPLLVTLLIIFKLKNKLASRGIPLVTQKLAFGSRQSALESTIVRLPQLPCINQYRASLRSSILGRFHAIHRPIFESREVYCFTSISV